MKKLIWIYALSVATPMISAAAHFTPEEARRVYGETSSTNASARVTESGNYVFMKVSWDHEKDASAEDLEEREMSAMLHALTDYVKPESVACTNSPFCKSLTDWMDPEFEFNVQNVSSSTLKEFSTNGVHYKIMAFDAVALKSARSSARAVQEKKNHRSDGEWLELLKGVWGNFKTLEEKEKFYTLLGCPIVNVVRSGDTGGCKRPLKGAEKCCEELNGILGMSSRPDSFFAKNGMLLWPGVVAKNKGGLYPVWQEDDGGRFKKAVELYKQGKDLPKIINLLVESISMNPIGSDKWGYLGGALKVSGKHGDALFAYLQALRYNPKNSWAWAGLRDCCEKCGFTEHAKGLSWFLKLQK